MGSLAINGLGRIGRAALKIIEQADGAEVVAVNDLVPPDNLAYLLRYDTVYGRWHKAVTADSDALTVQGRKIPVLAGRDPAGLPRRDLGVDLVLECTGVFRREEDLRKHLTAGARRVILSAPARTETVATVVHGVNQAPPDEQVVSCASSTGSPSGCRSPSGPSPTSRPSRPAPSPPRRSTTPSRRRRPATATAASSASPTTRSSPPTSSGDLRASVVDAAMTRVADQTLVKVMSWYDNERGFTCQMIREAFTALGLPAPDLSQARP